MENQNPFNALPARQTQESSLIDVEQQRAVAEVQAALIIAKRFPRDQKAAMDRILTACTRPTLAEKAVYAYSRGGTDISGASIRLAEAIAQNWGNLQFGIRELSQANGESTVESYAWDIETNTRQVKTFQVPHIRYSKAKGNKELTDPRDIYELVANNAARRLRAVILGIIPSDVVEAAMKQCEVTLKTSVNITPELIQSLLDKFAEFSITKAMLEARIQRRIDAITPALVVQLGRIYNSLKDGMGSPSDWFDIMAGVDSPTASDIEVKFSELFTGIDANNSEIIKFVDGIAKKYKTSTIVVKENAVKDADKFLAQFKKFLAKQPKPETVDLTPAIEPQDKPSIFCRKTDPSRGVFVTECQECSDNSDCEEFSAYNFDKNQKK